MMLRGRQRLVYGVGRVEVEAFVVGNGVVSDFLGKFGKSPATRREYARALAMFFKWLRLVEGVGFGPGEFLDEHLRRRALLRVEDRRWALKVVLKFCRDNPLLADNADGTKYGLFAALKGFFDYHEASLTSSKGVFGRREKVKYRPKQMNVDLAKRVLAALGQRERAICLCMLQSGQSIKQILEVFNFKPEYLRESLRSGAQRIRLDFDERKRNGFTYFTFISQDAVQELRKWLAERDRKLDEKGIKSNAIFVTRTGKPLKPLKFAVLFNQRMHAAKLSSGPYSLRSHMFRKLFKSEASVPDRGIDPSCVEFWMGHAEDIKGKGGIYDRSPELYADMIEKEYAKLEPYINIYSSSRAVETGLGLSEEEMAKLRRLFDLMKAGKLKIED